MNGYYKRVLLLSATNTANEKCLLRLESNGNLTTISGELFSADFTSDYSLTIYIESNFLVIKNINKVNFSGELLDVSCEKGASAMLTKNGEPILFGLSGNGKSLNELLSLKEPLVYNDELIATENYYKENYEQERLFNQTSNGNEPLQKEEITAQESNGALLYEDKPNSVENANFYAGVKEKVEELLSSYPKNEELEKLLPNSRFCKINYDSEKFYSVGIISENDCVTHLCYAVKGNFSSVPTSLQPYCRFMPLSPFAPYGDGYYLIFQNADNGETLTF
ncbi:MAG: hypothetical protein IKL82_02950 [Clostridia bacterium]|nr:hypothetical protein [Clostridia bacterium]